MTAFVAVLLLVGVPVVYGSLRLSAPRRPWVVLSSWVGFLALLIWAWPGEGADFLYLKRFNLVLAAVTSLVLFFMKPGSGRAPSRIRYRLVILALAVLSLVNYLNYFSFHGERTFLHLHDVAHYYLGAKYFEELGYEGLYTGMLRAEAELYDDHFKSLEARDLESNELVPIQRILRRSETVKSVFTPQRWQDFKADVALFRQRLGPQWATVVRDHGYNPTPVWTLIGSPLANLVPAGSHTGVLWLAMLDPLLLAAMFVAVVWAFGLETGLLAIIYFSILFGATFGWTGGAFLRFPWLAATVGSVCCLQRGRHATAGALLAAATALRVFPGFLAVGLLYKAARKIIASRSMGPSYRHFFASFVVTMVALLAASILLFGGLDSWGGFRDRIERQTETISPNIVGLTRVFDLRTEAGQVTSDEFRQLKDRRQSVYRTQLLLLAPLALFAVWLLSREVDDVGAAALGIPLLVVCLNLAGYYYVVMLVVLLAHRSSANKVALLFMGETIIYTLMLFQEREATLYSLWSLTLIMVLGLIYSDTLWRAAARIRARGELVNP